jgi:triphosphoribosyl-dephospho-CoA synthetase
LEAVWDGRLVLFTRRAGLVELTRRFDIFLVSRRDPQMLACARQSARRLVFLQL